MRLRGASAKDLQELGIDTEGMTDGKKSIVQLYKSMADIDIMEGTNYKSTFQILDELHEKWASLNDAQHAAISEMTGGKRAGSVFASLMTNWEDAKRVVEMAENSTGSAMQEQAHYAESIQYSIDRLKASGQELAYNFLDSGALKAATELLVSFTNAINAVTEATDGLILVLAGAGLAFYAFNTVTGLTKNLVSGVKLLQGAFAALTASKIADTAANKANTISEDENTASKLRNSAANDAAAASQARETASDIADSAADTLESLNNIGGGLIEVGENAEGAAGSTGVLGTALTALGPIGIGVTAAFVALAGAAYLVYQRNEQLKESAQTLGNEFATNSKELQGYQSQIEDLNKTLNSSNTSYEDAKAAREQLMNIQSSLIEQYGSEAGTIELVTQAIEGQVEALDSLNARKWRETKNEFNKTNGIGFLDWTNQFWHNYDNQRYDKNTPKITNNIELMQDEMFNARVRLHATAIDDKEFLQQIEEAIGGEYEVDMNAGTLILSGNLNDVKDKLYQIQNAAEKIGISDNFMQGLTKQINEVENTLTKYQDMVDQWTFNEDIMPNYSEQFRQMQNGYQKYQDAIVSGNALAINEAKDNFANIFDGIGNAVANDKNKDRILAYFRNMYPDLKSEIGSWQLGRDLADTTVDTLSVGFSDALSKFHSLEELKAAQTSADQEMQSSYMTVEALANQYGLTVDGLIAKLKELGQVPLNFRVDQTAVDRYQDAMYRNMGTYRSSEADKLDSIINQSQYKDQINTFGDAYWDAIAQAVKEAQDANNGLELSEKQLKEVVDETTESYIEQANAVDALQKAEPFSGKAFAEAKDELGNLTELYKKFVEQTEKDPTKIRLDISDVEKLRDKWEAILGSDAFNQFELILTSPLSTEAEVMTAFNQAATEYVKKQIDMSGATEETGEMVKAELTQMGLLQSDVNAFVDSAVRAAQIEQEVTAAKASGKEVSARLAELYAAEGTALGYTNEELVNYVVEMAQADGLEITGDLSWLDELCKKLGISIGWLNSFKTALSGATASGKAFDPRVKDYIPGGAPSNIFRSDVNKTNARVAQQIRLDRAADAFKVDTGNPGGGGGSKDAEKEKDILAELSKQLDEIQAAYSSLSDIVKSYNENGKLTIDQAQALINTDFRYLAMLKQENGQLVLNEEGLQNMAKAKLQEMQIQLARNAIDTVNGLKTEADAVNFLTYAYEGLAGATLDATEAQLQFAVAAAKAKGGYRAEAAEKIYQGYQATKVAIGNTDFSGDSLRGDKNSDKNKDKDNSDRDKTEKEQKETKTKWNWLEKLVEKIQRSIDKLAKKADKYFTYQAKNSLVDKQLEANAKMIQTQQFATSYYQKQADKALKKVPKKYRNLVTGDFDPTTVKKLITELGEGKTKKLEDYLEWKTAFEDAEDALEEAYNQERELIDSKLTNILDYFDALLSTQDAIISRLDAQNRLTEAKGEQTTVADALKMYAEQKNAVNTSGEREAAYKNQYTENQKEINDSYNEQIEELKSAYQYNAKYLKWNKMNVSSDKHNVTTNFEKELQSVAAEDIDDYLDQALIYWKNNSSKNAKKQAKADAARKIMDEYVAKGTKSSTELTTERNEALKKADNTYQQQVADNETATKEYEISVWETIKSVFDKINSEYDKQISKLSTIVDKYSNISDILNSVNKDLIEQFNAESMFGGSRSDAVNKAVEAIGDQIKGYQKQYDYYQSLINAGNQTDNKVRAAAFRKILESNTNLSDSDKSTLQTLIADVSANKEWTDADTWMAEWEEVLNGISSNIASSLKQITSYVQEASDDLLKSFDDLKRKELSYYTSVMSSSAEFIDQYGYDTFAKKYGLDKVMGVSGSASSLQYNSIQQTEDLMNTYKQQSEMYQWLYKAWEENKLNSQTIQKYMDSNSWLSDDQRDALERIKTDTSAITEEMAKSWLDNVRSANESYLDEAKKAESAWDKIFSGITEDIENQSKELSRVAGIYSSVNDLISSTGSGSVLLKYGLSELYQGTNSTNGSWLSAYFMNQSRKQTGKMIQSDKDNLSIYTKLINAANNRSVSAFQEILDSGVLSETAQEDIKAIIQGLTEYGSDWDISRYTEGWTEQKTSTINSLIDNVKKFESYTDEIVKNVIDASDETVKSLERVASKYSDTAKLLADYDSKTLSKYNISGLFGTDNEIGTIQSAIQSIKDQISAEQNRNTLFDNLISIFEDTDGQSRMGRLREFLDSYRDNLSENIVNQLALLIQDGSEFDNAYFDSSEYIDQFKDLQGDIRSSVLSLISESEGYGDQLVTAVKKTTQKVIEQLDSIQQVLNSKASLINEDWVIDVNGITEYGLLKANTLAEELGNARDTVAQYQQQLLDLEQNRDSIIAASSEEDYLKNYNDVLKTYYDSMSNVLDYENQLYEISQKITQAELDRITKLVENYKKALNAKKDYYDYDKTLKEKNKNIQAITAQINALEGVSSAAAKARLKSLEAELEEAQDDLDDTVFEHSIQVETDALDKLIEDMSDALDNSNKTLEQILTEFLSGLNNMIVSGGKVDSDYLYGTIAQMAMTGTGSVLSSSNGGSSTVASDINAGVYSAVSASGGYSNINEKVVAILSDVSSIKDAAIKSASCMDFLPNILTRVENIAHDTSIIASCSMRMTDQLDNIYNSTQTINSTLGMIRSNNNDNSKTLYKQLNQVGLKRKYK